MKKNNFFPFLVGTFFLAWILGVWRFSSEIANQIYQILLFPSHFILGSTEQYGQAHPGTLLGDEIVQGGAFLLMVAIQSFVFYFIWNRFQKVNIENFA